ncbi:aminopeptidase P family protein [Sphingobacterium griseoflavum]|uniref:Xaa-Pro aminopeptidase n=1 Tax=Sphingobacterium griseoflavum TaxID=1474952 RepID=A0ABQ3I0I0_9SPHI|nr:aminopeptidase P family protein [Sphingobacterium griseoflavum]GHE42287.1 Xaa-Pro aminopeptidase [Sphingobacterium griseoflavum]
MFSSLTYQHRRDILQDHVDTGLLLFLGNIENPINFEHNTYPFRQDSTFLYYFGIQVPNLAAVIDLDNQRIVVFGDELNIDQIVWMGRQETLREKCDKSGITDCRPLSALKDYISKASLSGQSIHYLPPYQSANKIRLGDLLTIDIAQLKPSEAFIKAVVAQRSIKETQEIAQIEEALRISVDMHLLAMRMAKPGMKEIEVANAIRHLAADQGAPLAYPPIVTIHGEILHNSYQLNTLKDGDMLLNDSGAETAMGYAGDLTRTFPVGRTFSSKQREIYDIVLQSFTDARELLRPGIAFKDVHISACRTLVAGLIDIGLMKGDPDEAVRQHAHTLFFQCGLGHMMGLDVHDMEDLGEQYVGYTPEQPKDTQTFGLKSLRLGKQLEEGFVVTVEPGVYIIPELIDRWQAEGKHASFINYDKVNEYRDFGGIRIEDNFLISTSGYRLLGPELVKAADDIEKLRLDYVS